MFSEQSGGVSKAEEESVVEPDPGTATDDSPTSQTSAKPRQQQLKISDRCRQRLQSVLEPNELLRIGVRGGGCSGFEYEFSIVKTDTVDAGEDLFFEDKVVVDRESIEYMTGAEVDYEQELIRSGFRIVNPLAEKGCSCGASFSLKF